MNRRAVGKFITMEGQDGAGKTTNLAFVRSLLEANDVEVLVTREPGGTGLGDALRELLLNRHDLGIDPLAELLMIFAARAQHLVHTIRPALEAGNWVLCDRFTDATFAYQCGGRGLPAGQVEQLQAMVQGELKPDLTLLLDVDPDTGRDRSGRRNSAESDRFESEPDAFRQRVREAYLELARRQPQRVRVIDASAGLEAVQKDLRRTLLEFLEQNR